MPKAKNINRKAKKKTAPTLCENNLNCHQNEIFVFYLTWRCFAICSVPFKINIEKQYINC